MATPPSSSADSGRRTLADWLSHCEQLHPRGIDMSLDRVAATRDRLALETPGVTVVVAGTNGKGSSCAMLESIALAAGLRVGTYSKPHLQRFEERCRIDGREVHAEQLLPDFEAVEAARGDKTLTYFEFTTLAIARHLSRQSLDLMILEVGLGGARDAVNVFDGDCVLITGVDIDHVDILGPDRESIGREKAGVMRAGCPAVVAEPDPPSSLVGYGAAVGATMLLADRDFHAARQSDGRWRWEGWRDTLTDLPIPSQPGAFQLRNAAGVLAVLQALADRLPVSADAVRTGLSRVQVPGRLQTLSESPRILLDVAHNRQSVAALFEHLAASDGSGTCRAVFGCMRDKAVADIVGLAAPHVGAWYCCDLDTPRAMPAADLVTLVVAEVGSTAGGLGVTAHASPRDGLRNALRQADPADTVVVFGSFFTVADVLHARDQLCVN